MKTAVCRDGVRNSGAGSGRETTRESAGDEADRDGHADLTVSVFLRGGFVRGTEGHDEEAGTATMAASVEERVQSLYPGASVSVLVTELLDSDWEVEIGELGRGRIGDTSRRGIERHLRSVIGEAITVFGGAH
jgi:hypothetical protein